jgi:Spy/CpxP family protein refolding chaperone
MMGGGYGPGYGQGYGMMGGGYGPGYGGMMGRGYGPGNGMGPGMMGGGYGYIPDLSDAQRTKLAEIQQEFAKTHWALMSAMHGEGGPMAQMYSGDEKAVRQGYEAMSAMHKQMFESSLEMRKRMEAVLTDEQRAQTRRYWR